MGFFKREKKDGTRAPGYGIYLLAGVLTVGGVMFLHHRLVRHAAPAGPKRVPPSNVAPITGPAAAVARVDVKAPPSRDPATRSFRLPPKPSTTRSNSAEVAGDSFNPIQLALHRARLPADARGEQRDVPPDEAGSRDMANSAFAELPPAFPTDAPGNQATASVNQLFSYRDPGAIENETRVALTRAKTAARYFAPKGTLIAVYLLTTVDTTNPAAIIQFGTAKPLVFNHRHQLPFGTRFLGKLSGQPARNRINLAVDTILYPDGLELPVSATAVEADERGSNIYPGVAAYYIPPPQWAQISPYIADFISGYLGLLQARAEQSFAATVGGVSIRTSDPANPRPPLYEASSRAIQNFTEARLKEIEQRYATAYVVPAGTKCWLQLDRDLDLSRAHDPARVVTPEFLASSNAVAVVTPASGAPAQNGRDLPLSTETPAQKPAAAPK